jgi:hypothetical protein
MSTMRCNCKRFTTVQPRAEKPMCSKFMPEKIMRNSLLRADSVHGVQRQELGDQVEEHAVTLKKGVR